ncbi:MULTISPECIES: response regulator transcription factor [Paenibacillus]|uniref:DNA-binding response regulator n=1 Tax=Paenibacillus albilobatus TaxID=2716884 RepID=A0A920C9R1_9BACL|nr:MULTISPECIES: response regulator transcription factor [Paenibacillus]MDR9854426.1 response regulator transcription factor [Paenibacillus sp. VCA1]GIO30118.1 DNA-binding response regulator [Paenibacillus albilobatus]
MSQDQVLIVDDEWNMRNLLRIYLMQAGFGVREAASGREALDLLRANAFDAVILDIMMPDMDGWQVCGELRAFSAAPVLMLSARSDTKDIVKGLKIGADDYLPKPFQPEELTERIRALIRRSRQSRIQAGHVRKLELPGMTIYPEGREVLVHDTPVDLTQKEFDILLLLAENEHRVYSRDMLIESLWGNDYAGDYRVVDTHVKNIREKVQRAGLSYTPIQTVWGIGYRWQRE